MRTPILTLLLFTFLCTCGRAQKAGTDYAFLFYTADYTNGWTDLPETKTRLPELATELRDNYNFEVETYGDLNLAQLKAQLAEINDRPFDPDDQVLFFFTGHGYYQPASDNGYLIPSDGPHDWKHGDGWLSYNKLREYLGGNKAKHLLVAFDACHSGSFGRRTMGKPGPLPWEQEADCATISRNSLRHQSRLFFSSGNKDERVPAQSEFLSRWLQCLREQPMDDKYVITDDDLRGYVNTVTSSSPEDGSFQGHSASGKFVFIHKDACSTVVDPLQAADNAHWAGVQQSKSVTKANEHIELYGKCSHYKDALNLLTGEFIPEGLVSVPGGTFQMGDTFNEGHKDEKPVRTVTVSPFQMGRYEVTVEEYDKFTLATGGKPKGDILPSWKKTQPYTNTSWLEAISYCNWRSVEEGFSPVYRLEDDKRQFAWLAGKYGMPLLNNERVTIDWSADGYRLPTEAEWEFAASYLDGSKKARFGNGKYIIRSSEANFNASVGNKKSYSETGLFRKKPVLGIGLNSPNKLGLYHMAGNLWEWCSDWYSDNYQNNPKGNMNPTGPSSGTHRILRGGSWKNGPIDCRAADRGLSGQGSRHEIYGFRVVRSPRK